MLDLDLKYFLQIAESGSLAAASVQNGLSVSALSRSVRRLEARVQVNLLERSRLGVTLTAAGKRLFERTLDAEQILLDTQRELSRVANGRSGKLAIAVGQTISSAVVRALIPRLRIDRPATRLRLDTWFNDEVLVRVESGQYDFGVCVIPGLVTQDLTTRTLAHDAFVPVVHATHPLAGRKKVKFSDLKDFPWIGAGKKQASFGPLKSAFAALGRSTPSSIFESNSYENVLTALQMTAAISFAPRWLIKTQEGMFSGLCELDVPGLSLHRPLGIVWRKRAFLTPVAERAIELIAEALNHANE